ncbi:DUF4783 domain-containing protein [Hydrotalea sp.]|uniref:DUF4783 domain-containing protein n=1 Tax=Hydrotalea sp. TaxID=2881279 RepID=UPI002603A8D8|nr:DUF4783 domain-containing protein [Hydrotalea sp.]
MKKFLLLISLGVVMASFTVQSDVSEIVNALKSANAESVSGYFDSYIDLTLPGKEEVKNIGKNQAGIALRTFFNDAGIHGFDLTSQREAGTTMYMAGKLNGKNRGYNITLLLRNKDGHHQIISVRIN